MTNVRLTPEMLDERFRQVSGYAAMPHGWTPVAVWIRVSSGKQDEANQVPQMLAYCAEHHYWPARWYVVHAKSASKGEHQGDLDRAVEDMRLGQFALLVIWHSDRIERRKGKALLDTLAEFADAGGAVESVQEPMLGQVGFGGEVTTFITGLMNAEKIEHLKVQVTQGHDRIRANKAVGPGSVPWGYVITGAKYFKSLEPTDLCRRVVPQIFARCLRGESCRTIARWLDAEGIPPKRGSAWHEGSVRKILHNMTYAGRWQDKAHQQTLVKCAGVIGMDTFEQAQQALAEHPRRRGPVDEANRPLLASLKCARCEDSPMFRVRTKSRTGRLYFYYRCTGHGPKRTGCGNMVPYEATNVIITTQVLTTSNTRYKARTWVKGINWDAEIAETKQELREANEAERFEDMAALQIRLKAYRHLNETEATKGHWAFTDTDQTEGEHFYDLDDDGKREYLKTRDIRVEKAAHYDAGRGIRVVIDGVDRGVYPYARGLTSAA
jgi:DNA invertase Pin-like site-specific DNA recombinase